MAHLVTLEYVTSIPKKRAGFNLFSSENQAICPAPFQAPGFTELDLHNLGFRLHEQPAFFVSTLYASAPNERCLPATPASLSGIPHSSKVAIMLPTLCTKHASRARTTSVPPLMTMFSIAHIAGMRFYTNQIDPFFSA